jgi:hypothetical protein
VGDVGVVLIFQNDFVNQGMRFAALLGASLRDVRIAKVPGHAVQRAERSAAALVQDDVDELGG